MGYIYLHVVVFSGSKALFREFLGALQVIQMALRSIPLAPLSRLQLQSLRGEYPTTALQNILCATTAVCSQPNGARKAI